MLDKAVMRLSGIKQLLGLLAGLDILQAFFIIGQAFGLSAAITGLWLGQSLGAQVKFILLFVVSHLGRHLINYVKDQRLDTYAADQAKKLRTQLLEKLFDLGPQIVQKEGSGNVITMALDGISQVENYLHLILNKMMNMAIIPWVILAFVAYLDWRSALILLAVFPLIIIFMIILGLAAKSKADKQYQSYQVLSNHFLDSLRGIATLKYFGVSKAYGQKIYETSEDFRKATMSTLSIGILSTFALEFFTTLSIAIVAVMLGLRLINGHMELLPALTVLVIAPDYFLPVRDFSSDYHATLDGKNTMTAIQSILNQDSIEGPSQAIGEWSDQSQLDLKDLQVAYGDKIALDIKDLSVQGYQKIGVVGMSGSGKSTLINLLAGFLDKAQGQIQMDGSDLPNFNQVDWRKQLLYIPQSPYVFEMSLADNIRFYQSQASDDQVRQAIEVVGLTDLVAELPQGIETRIGNGARPLSGGQAQRIDLARAFLDQDRKVMLLDEPTAHLDIETEVELKEKMLPLMEDRLVFLATHRLHWLKQMDLILVLDQGQMVEVGTYDQLMDKKGHFYALKHAMGGDHD